MTKPLLILAALLLLPLGAAAQGDPPDPEDQAGPGDQGDQADREPQPRYLAAIEGELEALRIPATCEGESATRARCSYTIQGRASGREMSIHLVYSDETDTIYFYVDRYLVAPPDAEGTAALLRRLMELNWQMLVGKFEWDPTGGEVRLAFVQNTDSNFDRRSFRSLIRTIGPLAERYLPELTRIAGE